MQHNMVGQTSPVWLFFRKIDNNIAQCVVRNKKNNECGAKISRSTHSSTSALIKHLKSHHREQHAEVQKLRKVDKIPRDQPTLHAAMSTGTGSPIPSTSQSQGITSFYSRYATVLFLTNHIQVRITSMMLKLKSWNRAKLHRHRQSGSASDNQTWSKHPRLASGGSCTSFTLEQSLHVS